MIRPHWENSVLILEMRMQTMLQNPNDRRVTRREWREETLRYAASQSHSTLQFPVAFAPSVDWLGTIPPTNWQTYKQYEQATARDADGYREFVSFLLAARSINDYLRAEPALNERLRHYPEHPHTALSRLSDLLSILAEATRWSGEEHPVYPKGMRGPNVWNIGMLLSKIKSVITQEAQALRVGGC
jgi:hypothetical protein